MREAGASRCWRLHGTSFLAQRRQFIGEHVCRREALDVLLVETQVVELTLSIQPELAETQTLKFLKATTNMNTLLAVVL